MLKLVTIMDDEKYLRQASEEVDFSKDNIDEIVKELRDFLKQSSIGYALASIQLGIPKRIVCVKSTSEDGSANDDYMVLINPKIISMRGRTEFWEACFSCGTSNMGLVERPYFIKVEYYDENEIKHEQEFEGFVSTVLCHEIDHLDGVFHLDRAKDKITLDYEDRKKLREKEPYKIYSKDEDFAYKDVYCNKNVWGTICECGNKVFGFVNEHPWMEVDAEYKVTCLKCNKKHLINRKMATKYYEDIVLDVFKDVKGRVLELGSGGGFVTKYLASKEDISYVMAIDIDDDSNEFADKYVKWDINKVDELDISEEFDYVVCRDVFMYLDNLEHIFSNLAKISSKIVFLNWYNPNHKNCHNKTLPIEIFNCLKKYYHDVELSYPTFYKCGYLIRSK